MVACCSVWQGVAVAVSWCILLYRIACARTPYYLAFVYCRIVFGVTFIVFGVLLRYS